MRMVVLSTFWTILIDVFAWLIIHMGVSYGVTQSKPEAFDSTGWLFRARQWEENGRIYETLLKVKSWKDRLPGGPVVQRGGLQKNADLPERGYPETVCRGNVPR